jgi:DNA polymerase-1
MKTVHFNPSSRQHIAHCLKAKYNWSPKEFTDSGQAKIDDEVLNALVYPEAKKLAEYFLIEKRISQLAEGDKAWLKLEQKGRIHSRYNPNGTVTGRATHSDPNIAQVPKVQKSKAGVLKGLAGGYGFECRSLFHAPEGFSMVGADMSGLELRCLAHYMAYWDKGDYVKVVTEGDVHTVNQTAAGLPTRDAAKTFIYAFLYGAGDGKIGSIINGTSAAGKAVKARFMQGLPALGNLQKHVLMSAKKGHLVSLDGRRIPIRSSHAALNSLLQSCGSILCKAWLLAINTELQAQGLVWGKDYYFLGWIHDEVQIAVRNGLEGQVGETAVKMAAKVGEDFSFRCPLAAEYRQGTNWAETH